MATAHQTDRPPPLSAPPTRPLAQQAQALARRFGEWASSVGGSIPAAAGAGVPVSRDNDATSVSAAGAASRARPLAVPRRAVLVVLAIGWVAIGLVAVGRYVESYRLYRGFPPPVTPAGIATGTTGVGSFVSRSLGRRSVYDIYLPPNYARQAASGRRFPVLYLLHAPPGLPDGIFKAGAVAVRADVMTFRREIRPMILVVPLARTRRFADDTEWANARAGRYDSFVVDIVHAIDRRFATIADRQHRGIGGLSEGGYGAINVALHHLALFSVAQSWSGYFRQTATGPFAGASRTVLAANSPALEVRHLRRAIRRLGLRAWVYQGNHDDIAPWRTRAFAHELHAAGGDVRYAIFRGGHDWGLWRREIPRMLRAASGWFGEVPRRGSQTRLYRVAHERFAHGGGRHCPGTPAGCRRAGAKGRA